MSTDRDVTRTVRSWLEDGVTKLPDRVLDSVLDQLPATRQRRATWWPARRLTLMNNLRGLGVAAVAVVAVAALGYGLMQTGTTGQGPTQAPDPSAAQTAAPRFPVFPGPPRPVDAGIYTVGSDFQLPVSVTFAVPAGWLSCANDAGLLCPADGTGGVNIFIVTNVVVDPCDETALRNPAVGPTVEDLVTAVSSLPWSAVTSPTDITVDGFRGKELEVTAPTSSPCTGTDDFAVWATALSPRAASVGPGERTRLRILDVDGTRLVIAASYLPGTTSEQNLAEIDAIIDSVAIEP